MNLEKDLYSDAKFLCLPSGLKVDIGCSSSCASLCSDKCNAPQLSIFNGADSRMSVAASLGWCTLESQTLKKILHLHLNPFFSERSRVSCIAAPCLLSHYLLQSYLFFSLWSLGFCLACGSTGLRSFMTSLHSFPAYVPCLAFTGGRKACAKRLFVLLLLLLCTLAINSSSSDLRKLLVDVVACFASVTVRSCCCEAPCCIVCCEACYAVNCLC